MEIAQASVESGYESQEPNVTSYRSLTWGQVIKHSVVSLIDFKFSISRLGWNHIRPTGCFKNLLVGCCCANWCLLHPHVPDLISGPERAEIALALVQVV